MKEVEKKDVPEVSGGQSRESIPTAPLPVISYPQMPGLPTDPYDPLGDAIHTNTVKS
jgi:hypothetical protein